MFDNTVCAIAQSDRCLRTKVIDNARSELETFADACAFLDTVEAEKMALRRAFPVGLGPLAPSSFDAAAAALTKRLGGPGGAATERLGASGGAATEERSHDEAAAAAEASAAALSDEDDVSMMCALDESDEECDVRRAWLAPRRAATRGSLLDVVRRCNQGYDAAQFAPVFVGDPWRPETMAAHVGFASAALVRKLRGFHLPGAVAPAVEVGPNPLSRIASPEERLGVSGERGASAPRDTSVDAVFLAPRASSLEERTRLVAVLVESLVADADRVESEHEMREALKDVEAAATAAAGGSAASSGRRAALTQLDSAGAAASDVAFVPRAKLRDELQDVRPLGVPAGFAAAPVVQLERAAIVAFGIPSFGAHVNGYVVDEPAKPAADAGAEAGAWVASRRPTHVWLGRRALSKPTYPGLLDQLAAGAQPSAIGVLENARKECVEEASLPPRALDALRPAGCVSYSYPTRRGLSTKTLAVFDVELPRDVSPQNGDGEVEEFVLMPIDEAVESLRTSLSKWKPNAALVMLDFAMRHGFVAPDDPGYFELAHALRAAAPPRSW